MKRYVYSYINWFDHDLVSKIIESDETMIQVAKNELNANGYEVDSEILTLQDLKRFAFDCDSMIEIIEV